MADVNPVLEPETISKHPMPDTGCGTQPVQNGLTRHLTEGIVLLLLSAGAYAVAFVYEAAYANYFGIPIEFVSITIQNLLVLSSIIVCFLSVVPQWTWLAAEWSSAEVRSYEAIRPYILLVRKWGAVFVLLVVILLTFEISKMIQLMFACSFVLQICCDLVLPLFGDGEYKYTERLGMYLESDLSKRRKNANLPLGRLTLAIGLLITPFLLAILLGRAEAGWKHTFPVIEETHEVVLRRYGDTFVLGQIDPRTGELLRNFRLIPLADLKCKIVFRETGVLKVSAVPKYEQVETSTEKSP